MSAVTAVRCTALALLVVAGLSGCESFGNGPANLSRNGEELHIAVCTEVNVSEVSGSARAGSRRIPFVDLHGIATLEPGAILKPGGDVAGLSGSFESVDLDSVDTVTLLFSGEKDSFNAVFVDLKSGSIPEGEWLHPDGTVTAEPCA